MISMTERAANEVRKIVSSDATLEGQGLRVAVKGGGCAGFTHDLFFEEKPSDMDEVFESHGIKFYIDQLSAQYLEQTEIDYVEEAHAAGFKFINPNVKGSCGCGSSVSF
jgi:iron-sulfur cluster insertion protein